MVKKLALCEHHLIKYIAEKGYDYLAEEADPSACPLCARAQATMRQVEEPRMKRYTKVPRGWYCVKGRTTLEGATEAAERHRDETGQAVAICRVPTAYRTGPGWKAIARAL